MRILMLHCRYRQLGGEDLCCDAEADVLRDFGHDVGLVTRKNSDVGSVRIAAEAIGVSRKPRERVLREIDCFKPDVIHLQNVFPRWGPAALDAVRESGLPAVAAVRNYRMFCPAGTMFREGRSACLDCPISAWGPWPSALHSCYRGSRLQSAVAATSMMRHNWSGIHLLAMSKFIEGMLKIWADPQRTSVSFKPDAVWPDPGEGPGDRRGAKPSFLFAGRLVEEKGVRTLLKTWRMLGDEAPYLTVAGSGPLDREVCAAGAPVFFCGQQSHSVLMDWLGGVSALIVPSEWMEPFGRIAIEALAKGTPTIVSSAGGLLETQPTLTFKPGDADGLAEAVRGMMGMARQDGRRLRYEARERYLAHFGGEAQHGHLMVAYEAAGATGGASR